MGLILKNLHFYDDIKPFVLPDALEECYIAFGINTIYKIIFKIFMPKRVFVNFLDLVSIFPPHLDILALPFITRQGQGPYFQAMVSITEI